MILQVIGLTAIPEFDRYTLNPKLFIYPQRRNYNRNWIKCGERGAFGWKH